MDKLPSTGLQIQMQKKKKETKKQVYTHYFT